MRLQQAQAQDVRTPCRKRPWKHAPPACSGVGKDGSPGIRSRVITESLPSDPCTKKTSLATSGSLRPCGHGRHMLMYVASQARVTAQGDVLNGLQLP